MYVSETRSDRLVRLLFTVVVVASAVLATYPLIRTVSVSVSGGSAAARGEVFLTPVEPSLSAWTDVVLRSRLMWRSFYISTVITVLGTFLSLGFSSLFAYPLAHRRFPLRRVLTLFVVFTMIFRYPLIPYFLTIRSYGLMNTIWSQILPHLIVTFNLLILRTFFAQLPVELEEASTIEGANHLQIFARVTIPLSKPALATIGLYYAVMYWNLYLHPMLFLQDGSLYTLQLRLRMVLMAVEEATLSMQAVTDYSPETVRAATIIFATIPILAVYPFLQKYFVKGAMLGSLKG